MTRSMNHSPVVWTKDIRGRSTHTNVIPTVCNLKNMLEKLMEVSGDESKLKQWERRSYKAYQIDRIKDKLLLSSPYDHANMIVEHILNSHPKDLGASCIDIYLIAYVAQKHGVGKKVFFEYVMAHGITDKENTAQAIWQVGKGDGVFLGLLNRDGSIRDWGFFEKWISDKK